MSVLTASQYAQINAKVRALKSKMLTVGDYERLVQANNIDDVIRLLSTTPYGEKIAQVDLRPPFDLDSLDKILNEDLIKSFDLLIGAASGAAKHYLKLYKEKFYFDNLKVVLNAVHNKIPKQKAMQYILSLSPEEDESLKTLLDSQNLYQVVDQVRNRKAKEALTAALPQFDNIKVPIVLENALDAKIFGELWRNISRLSQSDRINIKPIIGTKIDVINILTIMRCKFLKLRPEIIDQLILPVFYKAEQAIRESIGAQNLEAVLNILSLSDHRYLAYRAREAYEHEKSIFSIEHALNEYYIQIVYSTLIGFPFHIGVPISYLELKGQEIRNIKIIIVGKVEAVEPSKIRDLLIIF